MEEFSFFLQCFFVIIIIVVVYDLYVLYYWHKLSKHTSGNYATTIRNKFRKRLFYAIILTAALFFNIFCIFEESYTPGPISFITSAIPALLMLWGTNIVNQLCRPIHTREDLVDMKNYNLFLRSFASEKERSSLKLENQLCKIFGQYGRTFAIGSPGELITKIGAERVYVDDDGWKSLVKEMMEGANYILVRVSDTVGCLWELEQCLSNETLLKKTCFIVDSPVQIELLKGGYPSITFPDISIPDNGAILLYLNPETSECHYCNISDSKESSRQIVPAFISDHIASKTPNAQVDELSSCTHNSKLPKEYNIGRWQFWLNPVGYVTANKWPLSKALPACLFFFLTIWVQGFKTWLHEHLGLAALLVCVMVIYYIIYLPKAPHISYKYGQWPNFRLFEKERQFMKSWVIRLWIVNYAMLFAVLLSGFITNNEIFLAGMQIENMIEHMSTETITEEASMEPNCTVQDGKYSFYIPEEYISTYESTEEDGVLSLITEVDVVPNIVICELETDEDEDYDITTQFALVKAYYELPSTKYFGRIKVNDRYIFESRDTPDSSEDDETPREYWLSTVYRSHGKLYVVRYNIVEDLKTELRDEMIKIANSFTVNY